jgi:hypothetical protein
MTRLVLVALFACGGHAADSTTTPTPTNTGGGAKNDLCTVVDQVVAASADKFKSLHGSAPRPTDAEKAGIESGPLGAATWVASWPDASPDRLAAWKTKLLACPIGPRLVGTGEPHATERGGTPAAIDWTVDGANVELLAEGAQGVQLSVTHP